MLSDGIAKLSPSIFRAYDIRGIADETLTEEGVFLLGKAVSSLVCERGENQMVIARDGRLSGARFAQALSDGIRSTGCDVIDLGMVPTPLLYYATHCLGTRSGIVLTGSHNPPEYNGLKIVMHGAALTEQEIQNLHHRILAQRFYEGHGQYKEQQIVERYMQEVIQNVRLKRPLRIVVDAGNGVAGLVAPTLFKALGCHVHELYCDVDGRFPHHHADPSAIDNLQDLIRAVHEQEADIGLAFDGDGDRLGVVTNRGEIIWPDRLLMLFAQDLLAKSSSLDTKVKIIFDVKCTHHLALLIHSLGGEPIMWKTGHSHIKAKLAETKAQLAGEMSGHFFFKDRWLGFDDALYAGARLLEILSERTQDSHTLFSAIPNSINTPELKILVTDEEKFHLMQQLVDKAVFTEAKEIMTIDGLRVNFADGWGLIRPSNTTPYLILRFEALNEVILGKIQTLFREWMLSVKPDLVLPF